MALIETFPVRGVPKLIETGKIAIGSLSSQFPREIEENRAAFKSSITAELRLPVNVEEDLLGEVTKITEDRRLAELPIDYSKTYWNPTQSYRHSEVLTVVSQYIDFHLYSLPTTVLPPENDVKEFIDRLKESDRPTTIPQQLDIALDIAGNNIVGAANIGFIATRHMGRSYEQRAYPNIQVGPEEIKDWNNKVAQFEVYDQEQRHDGPGDTYYFWTHLFGALAYSALGDTKAQVLQGLLAKGTPLMRTVRTYIAKRPTETPHEEASVIGRNLGLALAESIGVNQRPIPQA
jgi:hypothetical protein